MASSIIHSRQLVLTTKDFIPISYTDEEEFRRIHNFPPKKDIHRWPDNTAPDVWSMIDGEASKVGYKGKYIHNLELRKSTTIKDKFTTNLPEKFRAYFSKVKIGVGSKHIYVPGDFMKEHLDTRKEDLDGLPHIMTMIITKDLESLKICGKPVEIGDEGKYRYNSEVCILFTLSCPHEVTEVKYERHSFVFPVYGIYTGLKLQTRKTTISVYDQILNTIDKADPLSSDLAELQGWLKAIDDDRLYKLIKKIRKMNGEHVSYDRWSEENDSDDEDEKGPFVKVNYTLNGQKVEDYITQEYQIPDGATHIYILPTKGQDRIMKQIRDLVIEDRDESNAKDGVRFTEEKVPMINPKTPVPDTPSVVYLSGRYFVDSTIETLNPQDKAVYEFLVSKGMSVDFVPQTIQPDQQSGWIFTNGEFVRGKGKKDLGQTLGGHIEFDDQGEYDFRYTPLYGVLVIN